METPQAPVLDASVLSLILVNDAGVLECELRRIHGDILIVRQTSPYEYRLIHGPIGITPLLVLGY